nr:hypothetical protein [uncultured Flavobacterium sp.]
MKLTPEQEGIQELEKKLKDAELERDILKKNFSIFIQCFLFLKIKYSWIFDFQERLIKYQFVKKNGD